MEGERLDTPMPLQRRLPPLEAWKRPEKWIDLGTGLARPYGSKIVIPPDNNGFVKPHEVVEYLDDLFFWKDYDWPYIQGDQETEPDDHHFYYDEIAYLPNMNGGSRVPQKFRELPINIGRMPRQFHNTIHDLTVKPDMPDMDAMAEYIQSYRLAELAFSRLFQSAKGTMVAASRFPVRRTSLESGMVQALDEDKGEAIMRSFFNKHFRSYNGAIEMVKQLPNKEIFYPEHQGIELLPRQRQVRKLGKVVGRRYVNFTHVIRAA